jgi:hypothetical protein
MPTNAELQLAFQNLETARKNLFEASEKELTARENLKTAEYEAIQDGKIDGKNEQIRKAQLAGIVGPEQDALYVAEGEKRKAALAYEIESMRVDAMKWQIRNDISMAALADSIPAVV